jgi:hypothetical protein
MDLKVEPTNAVPTTLLLAIGFDVIPMVNIIVWSNQHLQDTLSV